MGNRSLKTVYGVLIKVVSDHKVMMTVQKQRKQNILQLINKMAEYSSRHQNNLGGAAVKAEML